MLSRFIKVFAILADYVLWFSSGGICRENCYEELIEVEAERSPSPRSLPASPTFAERAALQRAMEARLSDALSTVRKEPR